MTAKELRQHARDIRRNPIYQNDERNAQIAESLADALECFATMDRMRAPEYLNAGSASFDDMNAPKITDVVAKIQLIK